MKKKILIFILCFSLIFTTSIYHDKNIQVVKANPALAISFITLALSSMGVTYYYQNAQNSLQNDIEIYCNETNQDYSTWIGTFGNIVVDVGKKVVKYTAAQVYVLKQFIEYLINKNEVSEVPISSNSFEVVPLFGYPCLIKVKANDIIEFKSANDNKTCRVKIISVAGAESAYIGFKCSYNVTNNTLDNRSNPSLVVANSNLGYAVTYNLFYSDGSGGSSVYSADINNYGHISFNNTYLKVLGSSPFYHLYFNDKVFTNCYFQYYDVPANTTVKYDYSDFLNALKLRFGFDSVTNTYDGIVLPSYSINRSVFNTADDTKPLVVSAPDVIDKAVDIAVGANPDATSVSLGDVAIAIDETAVGVINPAAEDEDEKVIAPDLSLPLDTTQDLAISDTITEDLVISDPVPPPDPPPDLPEIDFELGSKFPFSVFYDFVAIMNLFDATPVAPSFPLGFEFLGNEYEFTIDLSAFDSVARVLRLMELIAFISGLVILTIKYIRGKD